MEDRVVVFESEVRVVVVMVEVKESAIAVCCWRLAVCLVRSIDKARYGLNATSRLLSSLLLRRRLGDFVGLSNIFLFFALEVR